MSQRQPSEHGRLMCVRVRRRLSLGPRTSSCRRSPSALTRPCRCAPACSCRHAATVFIQMPAAYASKPSAVCVQELFSPLACGGKLVLAVPGGEKDTQYLAHVIAAQGVTFCHLCALAAGCRPAGGTRCRWHRWHYPLSDTVRCRSALRLLWTYLL